MDVAAIVLAVIAAVLSLGSTVITTRMAARQAEALRAKTKAEQLQELMGRYRDPLLRSAFDLQSRLYNIVELGFLATHYRDGLPEQKVYAEENTLFVLAEYLGWVEIMRREVRFLDLGTEPANRDWAERLDGVRRCLLTDKHDDVLRLFNGQQRAIGELMAVPAPGDTGRLECMGYAAFVKRLQEPEFSAWFAKLRSDIDALVADPRAHGRVAVLQHSLVDLIEFLDPDRVRLPPEDRGKLGRAAGD